MLFKLSTLMRSESQSEKGPGSVRVGRDASLSPALHVGRVIPACAANLSVDSFWNTLTCRRFSNPKRALACSLSWLEIYPEKRIREALPCPK
jgi:hypothetical protein